MNEFFGCLDNPKQMEQYRLVVLRARLNLEISGVRSSANTTNAVRKVLGSKTRSKKQLLEELNAYISNQ